MLLVWLSWLTLILKKNDMLEKYADIKCPKCLENNTTLNSTYVTPPQDAIVNDHGEVVKVAEEPHEVDKYTCNDCACSFERVQ